MEQAHRQQAVVLGGSIAGLAAARVLSGHFAKVAVLERDDLPEGPSLRKGAMQAAHGHGVLASGYRVLDEYFPGLMDELIAQGAKGGDVAGDVLWFQFGRWKLRADCGLRGISVTRPALEAAIRRQVRALPNVSFLSGHDVKTPVFDAKSERVTGVRAEVRATRAPAIVEADLVVDALGRGSPSPRWLSSWGYGDVAAEAVQVDVGYATGFFERRPQDLYGASGAIVTSTPPREKRHGFVLHAEGGRWIVTLMGVLGDHPPAEIDGWKEFARSLAAPEIFDLVKDRAPLGPLATYRFPANLRRRYARMARFPAGYLALGDAACSFNPIYGQGMSVALCQARVLDECLADGDQRLPARFFSRAEKLAEWAWTIATGEDFRFPSVEGKRPPGAALINRYMVRAHRAAARDPAVLRRFFEVANLLAPPTAMLSPGIAWRVLAGGIGTPQESLEQKVDAPLATA